MAASAMAAMAGDHGSRSSWPGLEKPRKEKVGLPGDRGKPGGSHRGEGGGRGSSAAAVRAKEKTADSGDLRLWQLRASSVLGEREEESGEQQGARGKARLLFVAARARGGALPRYQSWAAVAARPGAGGSELRGEEGWRRQAGPGRQRQGTGERGRRLPGAACWAKRPRRAAGLVLGCGAGLRVKERRPAGRNSRRKGNKSDSSLFFSFSTIFQNPF